RARLVDGRIEGDGEEGDGEDGAGEWRRVAGEGAASHLQHAGAANGTPPILGGVGRESAVADRAVAGVVYCATTRTGMVAGEGAIRHCQRAVVHDGPAGGPAGGVAGEGAAADHQRALV